ncbi:MAG: hypothetical protein H7144_05010, partial [Burkholderiales bacterium]|nr:hypothetical protein [Phycisphaerae bacterium]
TDAAQVNGIIRGKSGEIFLATSNSGKILSMTAGYAAEGTYESAILDAGSAASFGTMQLRGQLPEGTVLDVVTRSGNSSDAEKGGWSEWSKPVPAREYMGIKTPAARYMQYKLILKTSDPAKSPGADEIVIAYAKPNAAPRIAAVTVIAAGDAANPGQQTIAWEATDPNEDTLKYSVWARPVGEPAWVELAKDLTTTTFAWPAKQAVDGRYEVKVVASDAQDNQPGDGQSASRVSGRVTIDNTPPVIGDIAVNPAPPAINVIMRVVDRAGTIAAMDYSIDSTADWQRGLPDDTMADSPEERYTIAIKGLAAGRHTVTVRATDHHGNASFENVSVTVP